jgi:hypothetical protein
MTKSRDFDYALEAILIVNAFLFFISGSIYMFTEFGTGDNWKWFSRLAMALICFGLVRISRGFRQVTDIEGV